MTGLLSKPYRYSKELVHCWKLGATLQDRASLSYNTLLFHLRNAKTGQQAKDAQVWQCQIRLQNHARPVDFSYRMDAGDLFIVHEVFLDRCYQIPATLVKQPVRTIVDLGGNIGTSTLAFSRQFPQASKFVCVEPDPNNFKILSDNLMSLGNRAVRIEAAAGGADGTADFGVSPLGYKGSLGGNETTSGTVPVQCYRLDTLLDKWSLETVDVLKVDIEGAEREVFATRGDWWKRIKLVIAELHPPYGFDNFVSDMEANGFRVIPPGSEYANTLPIAVRS